MNPVTQYVFNKTFVIQCVLERTLASANLAAKNLGAAKPSAAQMELKLIQEHFQHLTSLRFEMKTCFLKRFDFLFRCIFKLLKEAQNIFYCLFRNLGFHVLRFFSSMIVHLFYEICQCKDVIENPPIGVEALVLLEEKI